LPFICPSLVDCERIAAMDDVHRLELLVLRFMRGVQTVQHAGQDADRDVDGHRVALLQRAAHELGERLSRDVFHHEKHLALGRRHVDGADHVRMLDARGQARLFQEHLDELGIFRELRMQRLDGDRARETHGPHQAPEMNRRHSPSSDLVE
jgi:hypothetical protein